MLIRLYTRVAGPGENHAPGDIIDVPEDWARALVSGGYAVIIDAPAFDTGAPPDVSPVIETAVVRPPEIRKPRGRK